MLDFVQEEVKLTRLTFDLEQVLQFQLEHDVQVIRGEDYQYMCYVDKKVYSVGLTPMYALVDGIRVFNKIQHESNLH